MRSSLLQLVLFGWLACGLSPVLAQTKSCSLTPKEARGGASNALRELVGQTGFSEQRGLGGTGVVARAEERGLGGTGIIGVVTGFGSVCVNGFEVEVDRNSAITIEGIAAKRADVQLGQLVEIEAYPRNGKLFARHVAVRVQVAGPIEFLGEDSQQMRVAGQTVKVAPLDPRNRSRLMRNDWVVVSGLRQDDGTILGTSIARLPTGGRRVVVSGKIEQDNAGEFRVGGLKITGAALRAGDSVTLRGDLTAGVMAVRDARVDTGTPFSGAVRTLSVQAEGRLLEAALSRASGAPVRLDAAEFRQAIGATNPMQADGQVRIGSSFAPNRVQTPEMQRPTPSVRPVLPNLPERIVRDPNLDLRRDRAGSRPDPLLTRPDRGIPPRVEPTLRPEKPPRPETPPPTPSR